MKLLKMHIILVFSLISISGCNFQRKFTKIIDEKYCKSGYVTNSIRNDEMNISYSIGGDGEALIFVHGFLADGKLTWIRQASYFKKEFKVVIPDLLWFGQSFSGQEPSLASQAKAIKTMMDSLQLSSAHLIGISYGGFILFELYRLHPEIFKSMVIIDSPGPVYSIKDYADFLQSVKINSAEEIFVPASSKEFKKLLGLVLNKPIELLPYKYLNFAYCNYYSNYSEEKAKLLDELFSNQERLLSSQKVDSKMLFHP